MSNSIPTGEKVIVSVVLAVVGFLVIYVAGFGISDNGAIGVALGLFLGSLFGPRIHTIQFKKLIKKPAKKKVASPAKDTATAGNVVTAGSVVTDAEILSIFVGNLAFKVRGRQLAELFEPFGPIESIRIVKDRNTGRGKGFGFVDMKGSAARKAIAELDGSEFYGRALKVSEANAQKNEE